MKRLRVLGKLYAPGNTQGVEEEFAKIKATIEFDKMHGQKSVDQSVLGTIDLEKNLFVLYHQDSVQMTGLSAIQYYAPSIFAQIGLSTGRTLLYQIINSMIALIAQSLCIVSLDYTGRRWTLIGANVGCGCMFIISFYSFGSFSTVQWTSASLEMHDDTSEHHSFLILALHILTTIASNFWLYTVFRL